MTPDGRKLGMWNGECRGGGESRCLGEVGLEARESEARRGNARGRWEKCKTKRGGRGKSGKEERKRQDKERRET